MRTKKGSIYRKGDDIADLLQDNGNRFFTNNVLHIANMGMVNMGYADLLRKDASATDIREFLVSGEQAAITVRIPDTLRDAAKEAASLKGTSLSAYVRECLIKELTNDR